MTTVTQAVEQRQSGPIQIMWSKRSHFRAVLPASVDVEAFLGTAAGALYASDVPGKKLTLMGCARANPDSLIVALMECAALGHMPGTEEYYLTPRMDHGRPKVLGIEGYRGVIERMYRSGAVAKVIVREVCAKDPFDYVEGRDRVPLHEVGGRGGTGAAFFGSDGGRDRGEMVGVYAYAELLTGAISRVVLLTRDDVFAARDSGGYKPDDQFTPWNRLDGGQAHPEFRGRSMWWKTGAKRLEPWVPTSAEYRREQLRASASAAELAGVRVHVPELPAPSSNGNGHAAEVYDAEIVEEPPATAEPQNQPARPPRAGKTLLGKLDGLLRRLPLGEQADKNALLEWQCGGSFTGTKAQAETVIAFLEGHLEACQGDPEEAASAIWGQYRAVHDQDASGEPEPGDG